MPDALRGSYTVSSLLILLLSVASSALGLTRDGHYADSTGSLTRLYAQDAVILGIAVPVLAVGLWYARRGSFRGQVVWLGTLAFMTYMWATYTLTLDFNYFFLGYLVLFSLSLFTLVGGVLELDVESIHGRLEGRLRVRLYGGFLWFATLGLAALWLAEIVPATLTGTVPAAVEAFGPKAVATYVIDLGIVVPSLALTARWIWHRRPWGYALTGVTLVFAAVLAPSITAITVVDFQEGVAMSAPVIAASIVPPLIGAAFAGGYLYRLGPPRSESE